MVHSVYPTWPWKSLFLFLTEQHRRSGLPDALQRCSRAFLPGCSGCLSALCPAAICQSHDQLQAKGNWICQKLLWEFSHGYFCCSLAFLFPLGFLYFALTVLEKQKGWQCMFMYCRLILPTLCLFSDFISLFRMHLKLYLKENTNLFKSYEYSISISHASMVWLLLLPYLFQNHIMQTIYLVQSYGTQAII